MQKMLLDLCESLSTLTEAKYKAAKSSASLSFAESDLSIIRTCSGVPFQLRFCPSLAKKPTPKADKAIAKKPNPFENPTGALLIASIPRSRPSHVLVLNKFPIIPCHFILATKAFKKQTDNLEPEDLDATYTCLRAWKDDISAPSSPTDRQLFAFFNSGSHSGASQPHRHVQFLPVESISAGCKPGEWHLLMNFPHHIQSMPFCSFAQDIPSNPSGLDLHVMYLELLRSCRETWSSYAEQSSMEGSEFSYNMAMTTSRMVLCPRTSEGMAFYGEDGEETGRVALNGTLLGGTLMVKNQEEWDHFHNLPSMLDRVLEGIGVPKDAVKGC